MRFEEALPLMRKGHFFWLENKRFYIAECNCLISSSDFAETNFLSSHEILSEDWRLEE